MLVTDVVMMVRAAVKMICWSMEVKRGGVYGLYL